MPISAAGNVVQVAEATTNDSDKTFVVPANAQWGLLSVSVTLVTTATVGDRQVEVRITDASDNTVLRYVAGAVQAASLTREYYFAGLHPNETAFTAGVMLRAIAAPVGLPAGWKIRVWDAAAVDAAEDDLTVRLVYEGRLT